LFWYLICEKSDIMGDYKKNEIKKNNCVYSVNNYDNKYTYLLRYYNIEGILNYESNTQLNNNITRTSFDVDTFF
jgi:hypothetical protein